MISSNSYMFWHWSAIFREFLNTKDDKQTPWRWHSGAETCSSWYVSWTRTWSTSSKGYCQNCLPHDLEIVTVNGGESTSQYHTPLTLAKFTGKWKKIKSGYFIATPHTHTHTHIYIYIYIYHLDIHCIS